MSNTTPSKASGKIVPARLDFLAIYNPELGTTEKTERDQVLFYYRKPVVERKRRGQDVKDTKAHDSEEQLRRVGLAQGIVNFARTFSGDQPADSIETEKHRIVVTQLEKGWWCLVSVLLTRLPSSATSQQEGDTQTSIKGIEYSSREVSPPALLQQQLFRAHGIFSLHHGPSLSGLYVRLDRSRFCNLLEKFWTPFADSWDVLLHGNPAVEAYGGLKIAAGGELGMGVGEEQWGSGEREVLEGLVRHTDGLVDLIVSRFGNPALSTKDVVQDQRGQLNHLNNAHAWLGGLESPHATDGLIFSGVGSISRHCLRRVTTWTENIYQFGEQAYGVRENPSSSNRRHRRRGATNEAQVAPKVPDEGVDTEGNYHAIERKAEHSLAVQTELHPEVPEAVVEATEAYLEEATAKADADGDLKSYAVEISNANDTGKATDSSMWTKYLTLGYGTAWGGKKQPIEVSKTSSATSVSDAKATSNIPSQESKMSAGLIDNVNAAEHGGNSATGPRFLIGLVGSLDIDPVVTPSDAQETDNEWKSRLSLRTLYIEPADPTSGTYNSSNDDDQSTITPGTGSYSGSFTTKMKQLRLRIVVYVHQPFIFTLLFEPNTSSLSMPSFFHELHRHLQPLHKPLLNSTSPANVVARFQDAMDMHPVLHQAVTDAQHPIYSLTYDSARLTIHSSIPNIPLPGTHAAEGLPDTSSLSFSGSVISTPGWTRAEALNVHSQILNTIADTRNRRPKEHERTAKTQRDWWVVWMRLHDKPTHSDSYFSPSDTPGIMSPPSMPRSTSYGFDFDGEKPNPQDREAILIRRAPASSSSSSSGGAGGAGDYLGLSGTRAREMGASVAKIMTLGFLGDSPSGDDGEGDPKGSARQGGDGMGIGVNARKYVEALMSLNR